MFKNHKQFNRILNNYKQLSQKRSSNYLIKSSIFTSQKLITNGINQQQKEQHQNAWLKYAILSGLGISFLISSHRKTQTICEESNDEQKQSQTGEVPTQSQDFVTQYKKIIEQFEIPKLLLDREKQKLQEYEQRADVDLTQLDKEITAKDIKNMSNLDSLFWQSKSSSDEGQEASSVQDPYIKKQLKMKHQEYRKIPVVAKNLLKNGQMIQVAVSDPFNETLFHPTDKVIICKHNNTHYALGSYCGFDYTNLATGVLLGEKLICPSCGSAYNIVSGMVDQGPSLRNISSFPIQEREEEIQMIVPEHIPAFSKKQYLARQIVDPRVFVVVGDSETAISAIDALRSNFTGKIVCIPVSSFGAFENVDILNRKFSPLGKNETFYVEPDFFDRANVDVMTGTIKNINFEKKQISIAGEKKPLQFDKILIASGAEKKKMQKDYSNVYYIQDRHTHAKIHNEIIKANKIVILGGTFEAYQTASSIRDYLDSIGQFDTQIFLIQNSQSELQSCLGRQLTELINDILQEKRISVLMNIKIERMVGLNKLESIHFRKEEQVDPNNADNPEIDKNVQYFINPDIVIAEDGLGPPKVDLKQLVGIDQSFEEDTSKIKLGIDPQGIPASDIKFSLHYNDLHTPIYAAGSATQFPSFVHKYRIRTSDVKYNIESGFYAAMSMMDKRVEFKYLPFTSLNLLSTLENNPDKPQNIPIYFVGERIQGFQEIIIKGSLKDRKFIAFFVYGDEVIGFMTCGYQNLHLYLWEAMKMLIMPPASMIRNDIMDYKAIVMSILKMRGQIVCKRHEILNIPSITLAEYEKELDESLDFRLSIQSNIENANQNMKKEMMQMKEKLDIDEIQMIKEEANMTEGQQASGLKRTSSGKGFRPVNRRMREEEQKLKRQQEQRQYMGQQDENNVSYNPLTILINQAKKGFQ